MKKFLKIGKEEIEVSEELYEEYYKMDRRRRYLEEDVKVGRIDVDMEKEEVVFIPSKEDSVERLMDQGTSFQDGQSVEDIVCDKAMLLILQEALKELDDEEREIINDLYYEELTTRGVGAKIGRSHVTVGKKHKKALEKLKKYFIKNGYQNNSLIG